MDDKTCGTCKYRGENIAEEEWDWEAGGLRRRESKYFFCERIKHDGRMSSDLVARPQAERAAVVDGSGYYAALCVSDDFGCLEWSSK